MKVFDDPHFTELVIDDMLYHQFLFRQRRPDSLWYILSQAHSYWMRSLTEGTAYGGEALQLSFLGQSEKGIFENLNEDVSQKVEIEFLDDKELKKRVRQVIQEHSWQPASQVPACECGKAFDLFEQWANHNRSVIWSVLRESIDSARDSEQPQQDPDQADQADRGESEETA